MKIVLIVFASIVLMLAALSIGDKPAPVPTRVSISADTPREAIEQVCERAVMQRWPQARLLKKEEWVVMRNDAGNYKMLTGFVHDRQARLKWCVVQPVNGAMQLVSLS